MAVIVSQKANLGGKEFDIRVFLPKGKISKLEREKAERLDHFLKIRLPGIEKEMEQEGSLNQGALRKWHSLGLRLQFVDDTELIEPSDVHSRVIWLALREHCPVSLLPKGEKEKIQENHPSKREGKKYDHFEHCYKLGKFRWEDVEWVPTWTDWSELAEVPGIMRDHRIIPTVGKLARRLEPLILRHKFREIVKELRKEFPTKEKTIESTGLEDAVIQRKIETAFVRIVSVASEINIP